LYAAVDISGGPATLGIERTSDPSPSWQFETVVEQKHERPAPREGKFSQECVSRQLFEFPRIEFL
jgi:hypothetical protein